MNEAQEGTVERADDQRALHGDKVACLPALLCRCESCDVRRVRLGYVGVPNQVAP